MNGPEINNNTTAENALYRSPILLTIVGLAGQVISDITNTPSVVPDFALMGSYALQAASLLYNANLIRNGEYRVMGGFRQILLNLAPSAAAFAANGVYYTDAIINYFDK